MQRRGSSQTVWREGRAIPFFAGLILGEFVVGSIWFVIGTVTGIRTYALWVY